MPSAPASRRKLDGGANPIAPGETALAGHRDRRHVVGDLSLPMRVSVNRPVTRHGARRIIPCRVGGGSWDRLCGDHRCP